MKLPNIKSFWILSVIFIFILGCDDFDQENIITEAKLQPFINQINIKGRVFIPFATYENPNTLQKKEHTDFYEYSLSDNILKKTSLSVPKNYVGYAIWNENLYISTAYSIATYRLNDTKLERLSYLPTPKGDYIVACFIRKNLLTTVTVSDKNFDIMTWEDNKWKREQSISIDKNKIPLSGVSSIITSSESYLFYEKNKTTYYLNLEEEAIKLKETHINDLSNICPWVEKDEIFISGFNERFELIHYQLKGLNTTHLTTTKISIGEYPPFIGSSKTISLAPIQIEQVLKGFVYGAVDDNPIWISADKKEFPKKIVEQSDQKLTSLFYQQIGILAGTIFLFSFLAWKISIAWEQKFSINEIPKNTIFFGPTLHRGMAFLIDALTVLSVTHILMNYFPFNFDIFTSSNEAFMSGIKLASLESELGAIEKQIPFLITGYFINLIYGTLTEYFYGCTLGKFCLGLKVYSDNNLKKLNIFQAFSRNIVPKFPPSMPIILFSNITISITDKKKSLNDYAGNSVVLYYRLHQRLKLNVSYQSL